MEKRDNIMTDKWKYKSVSLKESTYSELNDLQKTLVPGLHLSNAKVVEKLIKDKSRSVLAVETLRRTQMAKKSPKSIAKRSN